MRGATRLLMILAVEVAASTLQTRGFRPPASDTRLSTASMSAVHIKSEPWPESPSPSECIRSAWLSASTAECAEAGNCGLEVLPTHADGLMGGGEGWPQVRPRAVLSGMLHVSRNFRRRGLAQRLLRAAEAQARWFGVDEMLLMVDQKNEAALKLYQKVGYRPKPVLPEHKHQVCMSKHLYMPSATNMRAILPQPPLIIT